MANVTIPLALPPELAEDIRSASKDTGLSQADVMPQSIKAGLSRVRERFRASSGRVTNVDPLPKREWERIYSHEDELHGIPARQLASFQSQEEPS